jgi:hypothetical protein
MKKFLSFLLIIASISLIACERDTTYDEFAQCLTDSGTVYYGAFWCHNCQEQAKLFGDSKDLIPYVECDAGGKNPQVELCLEEGIDAYPTWRFPDGSELLGLQTLKTLSEKSYCPLPGEERSILFE